ncbi:hypothetical protein KC366_g86 [Hortaea werneckii]|nr:hypothetical protein KC366_g86 [Hortaea werneckii]
MPEAAIMSFPAGRASSHPGRTQNQQILTPLINARISMMLQIKRSGCTEDVQTRNSVYHCTVATNKNA